MPKKSEHPFTFTWVVIHSGPLPKCRYKLPEEAGATLTFTGTVRPREKGRSIIALQYEVMQPLARTQLMHLADNTAKKYGLQLVLVYHSDGFIPVGKPSFRLIMSSKRRENLFAAMQVFIKKMKRFVAIDKQPIYL